LGLLTYLLQITCNVRKLVLQCTSEINPHLTEMTFEDIASRLTRSEVGRYVT
jgi:hypothetical protein